MQEGARGLHVVVAGGSVSATVVGSLLLATICAARRWWTGVALAVLGPLTASVLAELVLKPAVHRTMRDVLSFPSGTTTRAGALAAVVVVLLQPAVRAGLGRLVGRFVLAAAAVTTALAVSGSVVILNWHYPSDALAGLLTAVAVVTALVVVVDAAGTVLARWLTRRAGGSARAGRERPECGTRGAMTTGRRR